MKKILSILILLFGISSVGFAYTEDFIRGFKLGDLYGRKAEREEMKNKLISYYQLISAMLDYKKYLFLGEVLPPVVKTQYEVIKNKDGTVVLNKKLVLGYPDMDNITRIVALKQKVNEMTYIPEGFWVYLDISNIPSDKVDFLKYILQKEGYEPKVAKTLLVASVEGRKADALYKAQKLTGKTGFTFKYGKFPEFKIEADINPEVENLGQMIEHLGKKILEKEKKVYGIPVNAYSLSFIIGNLNLILSSIDANPDLDTKEKKELTKDLKLIIEQLKVRYYNKIKYQSVFTKKAVIVPKFENNTKSVEDHPSIIKIEEVEK